jgi:hypothetical protein
MLLTSSAFEDGEHIPIWYTRAETDCSPPLGWADVPRAAESLAVVCTSRESKGRVFYHWVVYNVPPEVRGLDGKQPKEPRIHKGICQSRNSADGWGWRGPDTERARTLRFRLFALDTMLEERDCGDPKKCVRSMDGHLLEEASLVGHVGYHERRVGPRSVDDPQSGGEG